MENRMAMSNKEGIDGQKSEIIYTCFQIGRAHV